VATKGGRGAPVDKSWSTP